MTDAEAIAEIELLVYSAKPRPPPLRRPNKQIVDRVRVLVERIRQSQANEDNLSRVIAALEDAERNRQGK